MSATAENLTPEAWLSRAVAAESAEDRRAYAEEGLSVAGPSDADTEALLWRELFLADFALGDFTNALQAAVRGADCGEMSDVFFQDAAKAALALGKPTLALDYLHRASAAAPPERRGFHLWSRGALHYVLGDLPRASFDLRRAVRNEPQDEPLALAHLALVEVSRGNEVVELDEIVRGLLQSRAREGYGAFVLGHLAYAAADHHRASRYLNDFARYVAGADAPTRARLSGELALARATLSKLEAV